MSFRIRKGANFYCLLCTGRQQSWVLSDTKANLISFLQRPPPTPCNLRDLSLGDIVWFVQGSPASSWVCIQAQLIFHALVTVDGCGRQAGRLWGGGEKEKAKLKRVFLPLIYLFALLLGYLKHCTDYCAYKPPVWDNLKTPLRAETFPLSPWPLPRPHLVLWVDLTRGPSSVVASTSNGLFQGAWWFRLNYTCQFFLSVKLEVRLPQPRVTW